jgi:hypothetical protein
VKLTTHPHLVPMSKNAWSYTSTPPKRLYGVVLSWEKHRDNFTFTLCILSQSYHNYFSRNSAVFHTTNVSHFLLNAIHLRCILTNDTLDDRGSRVRFRAGPGNLFTPATRTTLGPTHPPIQCVPGGISLVVKRPGREADNSPPSSAEVKE